MCVTSPTHTFLGNPFFSIYFIFLLLMLARSYPGTPTLRCKRKTFSSTFAFVFVVVVVVLPIHAMLLFVSFSPWINTQYMCARHDFVGVGGRKKNVRNASERDKTHRASLLFFNLRCEQRATSMEKNHLLCHHVWDFFLLLLLLADWLTGVLMFNKHCILSMAYEYWVWVSWIYLLFKYVQMMVMLNGMTDDAGGLGGECGYLCTGGINEGGCQTRGTRMNLLHVIDGLWRSDGSLCSSFCKVCAQF